MAAPTSNSIRVRLYFDYPPPSVASSRMCWLLVDLNTCRVVADLESIIREKFDFSRRNLLNLFIDDCYLPHTESIYVVRDNDSIRVKVDSLAQVNGQGSHPDASGDSSRKRPRPAEEDEPAENGVSVEWKKKKRKKKKSEERPEKDAKRASGGEQRKDSQRKQKEKKKGKGAEEKGPAATPKPTAASTKKAPAGVEQPARSTKKPPAAKAKTQSVSSSDSSDSSSEEDEAPKKPPAAKPVPKTPSSAPAPAKAPANAKLPPAKPRPPPSSSSSDTDSSSDEAPGKALSKNTPSAAKPGASATPKGGTSDNRPASESQPAPRPAEKQPAGRPETSGSDSEEEIKLVIRRPAQGFGSLPPWRGRGRGSGPGERGRGDGRGRGRGQSGDFRFSYDGGRRAEQPSYQNDSLSNKSVVVQNGAEAAPRRDYSSMPLLAAPPQVGQKIAFKLLELTENYTPEVSEYKEGKIVSFDPTTKQIELEVLNTFQAPVEPGKFDLVYQNPDGSERVEYAVSRGSQVTERWDSLLEPRLVI
ncbi:coilin [Centroberyx affinis]|uniref:coilin n=1 Tax=Centroberyx affinis TaxID=166261 RepID=UPI003A5BB839